MVSMSTFLHTGATVVAAAFTAAVTRIRRKPSERRSQRASGADPYAGQRSPEKLNPGLGGCASGGGG